MKSVRMACLPLYLASALLLIGTVFGGWQHGCVTHRWGLSDAIRSAARKLQGPLAPQHGNWRLVSEQDLSEDVVKMLQCSAYICRNYRNDQTGDMINVALMLGPPGPIAVHVPEMCYSNQGFKMESERKVTNVDDLGGRQHTFWDISVRENDVHGDSLRVLYGWGTGESWSASQNPRVEYASAPCLYKIQLAAPILFDGRDFDSCQDFLNAFLPELQQCLIPLGKRTPDSSKTEPL